MRLTFLIVQIKQGQGTILLPGEFYIFLNIEFWNGSNMHFFSWSILDNKLLSIVNYRTFCLYEFLSVTVPRYQSSMVYSCAEWAI